MASGALSGFTTVLITYPLDLARTRMSADMGISISGSPPASPAAHVQRTSMIGALRTVVRKEGVRGLYRGLFVSALEITPFLAISLGIHLQFFFFYFFVLLISVIYFRRL